MSNEEIKNECGKRSFVVYETFSESLKFLPDDMRLRLYDRIFEYGLYGTLSEDTTPIEKSILSQITFAIDRAKSRRKSSQENGSKGGGQTGNKNAYKDKKCTICIHYRKCTENKNADVCNEYVSKYDKNENELNRAKTSENDLNVNVNDNVNVNEFKADSLSENYFIDSHESNLIDEEEVYETKRELTFDEEAELAWNHSQIG